MSYENDQRVVMTLDAGGTNFVFQAIKGNKEVAEAVHLPANGHDLDLCLKTIIEGFTKIKEQLAEPPVAISFAFPGPADYPNGIIGDLGNLPGFRGGVALGPMLEDHFNLPTFINNDGDLYAYGEALAGFLPYVNGLLENAGSPKRFKNLVGFTLGTGFGCGIVHDGELFTGDNSGAGEVWLVRNKLHPEMNIEESVSARAVRRVYAQEAGISFEEAPEPKEIFEIGMGQKEGNKQAAIVAWETFGEALGDAIANVLTLIDGIAVIGGGLAGAHPLFFNKMMSELNGQYTNFKGESYRRLSPVVFNLENESELHKFLKGEAREVKVPGSNRTVVYDALPRLGVGISKLGTSRAVALGAYAIALSKIDGKG